MKYMIYFVILLMLISCSIDVKKTNVSGKDIIKNRHLIRQTEAKIANLTQKVDVLEKNTYDMIQEANSLQKKIKVKKQSSIKKITIWEPIKATRPIPVIKEAQYWAPKKEKMAKNIIKKFETGTKQKKSNSKIIGSKFPFLRFINSNGEVINIEELSAKKNILLVVLRGFAGSVCLVCSSQTIALSNSVDEFSKRNTEIILVYPGEAESIPHFVSSVQNLESEFSLPFPIVLDADLSLVTKFKINGSLAKPSTLLIDKDGIIRYAYVGKHPGDRPTIPSLLDIIDKLEK